MADSCYTLVINWNSGGQFASSILHYHFDDGGFASTQLAAAALIAAFDAANRTAVRAMVPSNVSLLSFKSRKVNTTGGFEAISLLGGSVAGTRAAGMMVAGVNPVVIFLPVANGKLRGKWFLPGISNSDVTDGVMTASIIAAIDGAMATILGVLTLTGGGSPTATMAIYSRKTKTWVGINAIKLSFTLGQQRRRQRPS